jgi:hypothetical protein
MATNPYTLSIRQSLNNKGINNNQIGFKNGYVTVNGNNFMKADKNYNGSTFTNQQNFSNAWNSYSQQANKPAATPSYKPTVPAGSMAIRSGLESSGYSPSSIGYNKNTNMVTLNNQPFMVPAANVQGTTYASPQSYNNALNTYRIGDLTNQISNNTKLPDNPYTSQIDDTIRQLMDFAKNQQQVDPYSTAQYAAYQAQSDRRANQGTRAAQESMGSAGFGRSTALGERAQGIQNRETEYLETQVIPQIIAQEQARQQQQYANMMSLLDPLVNQQGYADNRAQTELGNVYNALGAITSEQQRGYDNSRADAALTGNYMTPEAREAINTLLSLKQRAETRGISREDRAALSQQADGIRSQLSMMGIDPTQYGADVKYQTAAAVNPGRTLQGQQTDMQRQGQQFDQGMSTRQQNFNEGQQGWENQFRDRQQNFNEGQSQWENDFKNRQQTFNEGQTAWENQFNQTQQAWQNSFDEVKFQEDTRRFGLNYAIDLQAQNLRKNQFNYEKEMNAEAKKDMESQYKGQLADMILSQNLPDDQTEELFKKYGINEKVLQQLMSGN